MPERSAPLHGKDFLDWLERGGIIPNNTCRVVIDAQVGHVTLIYVEGFARRSMIEVDPPAELRGAKVRMAGASDFTPEQMADVIAEVAQ